MEPNINNKKIQHQLLIDHRNYLFIDILNSDVFDITENYRTKADPEYGGILHCLRTGHSTIDDAERFMKLCLHHHNQDKNSWRYKLEKHPKTIFLYTQNFKILKKIKKSLLNYPKKPKNQLPVFNANGKSIKDKDKTTHVCIKVISKHVKWFLNVIYVLEQCYHYLVSISCLKLDYIMEQEENLLILSMTIFVG